MRPAVKSRTNPAMASDGSSLPSRFDSMRERKLMGKPCEMLAPNWGLDEAMSSGFERRIRPCSFRYRTQSGEAANPFPPRGSGSAADIAAVGLVTRLPPHPGLLPSEGERESGGAVGSAMASP